MFSKIPGTIGLVACGGSSTRMGRDKSMLVYHQKPQRYHVCDMLQPFCDKVFISCKEEQGDLTEPGYDILKDLPAYNDIGPMAALLTAFSVSPEKNILLIGCDYPFLTSNDLQQFSTYCNENIPAAAFYNEKEDLYEPLLAWYNYSSLNTLKEMFEAKQYSLQHYLKNNQALKFCPGNKSSIVSVDTPEKYKILGSGGRVATKTQRR